MYYVTSYEIRARKVAQALLDCADQNNHRIVRTLRLLSPNVCPTLAVNARQVFPIAPHRHYVSCQDLTKSFLQHLEMLDQDHENDRQQAE